MTSRAVIEEFWQRFLFVRGLPQSARWQDCFHFETTPAGAEHALGLCCKASSGPPSPA